MGVSLLLARARKAIGVCVLPLTQRSNQVNEILENLTRKDMNLMLRAIATGDTDQVLQLLKKGISPNARQHGRSLMQSAMEVASVTGDLRVMRLLLEAGAVLKNAGTGLGNLSMAVSCRRYDMAELMVEFGADFMELWKTSNEQVLDILRYEGKLEVIENFARVAPNVNRADGGNFTLLHYAVLHKHYALARILIARGAWLETADGLNGDTPLHWAINDDDAEMVKLLLDAGASARVVNDFGMTPLDSAIASWRAGIAILLWEKLQLTATDTHRGKTLQRHFAHTTGAALVNQWCASQQLGKGLLDAFGVDGSAAVESKAKQVGRQNKGLAL